MVMDIVHKLKYVIEFKNQVDYFNVILQKQIDLRLKFDGNENCITIFNSDSNNNRFNNTYFFSTYRDVFTNYNVMRRISYFEFYDEPNRYIILKNEYESIYEDILSKAIWLPKICLPSTDDNKIVSYDEFEYNIDVMLEEFKLFCNLFEFNEDEKKIISSIVEDENLKSNIKFIGWKDYWIVD